jgi:hypothetical protein
MGNWYSARLLYESVHDPPEKPSRLEPLFEESIIVFYVKDEDSIHSRVLALAQAREHHYTAGAGNEVYWTFREILEVQEIMSNSEQIEDGTEVFYRWWFNPGPWKFKIMRKIS